MDDQGLSAATDGPAQRLKRKAEWLRDQAYAIRAASDVWDFNEVQRLTGEADDIDVILALSASPIHGGEWRPIEEAPRDGTPLLLGHAQAVFSGWWQNGEGFGGGNGSGWTDGMTDRDDDFVLLTPTHWQPLPPPPVPSEETK